MIKGILTESKVIDIRVTLFDGTFHNVDSDEVSFRLAATQAFKKGFMECNPAIVALLGILAVAIASLGRCNRDLLDALGGGDSTPSEEAEEQ